MSVTFFIAHKDADFPKIYAKVKYNSKNGFSVPTNIKIPAVCWDKKLNTNPKIRAFRDKLSKEQKDNYVNELTEFKNQIEKHVLELNRKGLDFNDTDLKDFAKQLLGQKFVTQKKEKPVEPDKLIDVYDNMVKTMETNINKPGINTSSVTSRSTIQKKKTLRLYLSLFDEKIYLKDINEKYINEFTDFLAKRKLANSTIKKQLDFLKAFIYYISKDYLINEEKKNQIIQIIAKIHKSIPVSSESKISLSHDEVQRIIDLDLEYLSKLDKTRDLFLFQLMTGQRYSDLNQITKDKITHGYISVIQQKTKKNVYIPVHSLMNNIFDKVENQYPSLRKNFIISNQKQNDNLKELCKLADINSLENYDIFIAGKQGKKRLVPKYELVTTHTARRTFITLCLKEGLNERIIKLVSGHSNGKSKDAFEGYADFRAEDTLKIVRNFDNLGLEIKNLFEQ